MGFFPHPPAVPLIMSNLVESKKVKKLVRDAPAAKALFNFSADQQSKIDEDVARVMAQMEKGASKSGGKSSAPEVKMPPGSVLITRGLRASDKVCESVPYDMLQSYLKKHTDCYERTNPTEKDPSATMNRVYVDMDGLAPPSMSRSDFDTLVSEIQSTLDFATGFPHSLMSSCQYGMKTPEGVANKLSFRLTLTHKHGTKPAVQHFVVSSLFPMLKPLFAESLPDLQFALKENTDVERMPYLDIDTGVYNLQGRKMRMWNSSKDGQNRPYLIGGCFEDVSLLDTLITYIPPDSERLPEPRPPTPPPVRAPEPVMIASDNQSITTNPQDVVLDEIDPAVLIRCLEGLAPKRWSVYDNWIRLGFICYNEGLGVDVWETLTKKNYPRYKNGSKRDCKEAFAGFKPGRLGQGTLWRWLKEDNRELYAELAQERVDFWNLVRCPSNAETAKFFYNLKPDSYAFHQALGWYEVKQNATWFNSDKTPHTLKFDVWQSLKKVLKEHQAQLDLEREEDAKLMKMCGSFAMKIGDSYFSSGVLQYLPACYNDDALVSKMDESTHLVAFTDKVYDLQRHEIRDIRPTDYVCLNTGYAYPAKSDPAVRAEVEAVLDSIWENPKLKDYVLKTIASCLCGYRRFEEFYVWTGSGGNGKGLLAELVKRAFGDYYHSIPHATLTKGQERRDAPCPALAKAKGKRFVQAQEPEHDDKLHTGMIKELTGGDLITARDLHKSTITYKPQFGLFLQTNTIPKLNKLDGGIKRRMVIVPFPLQFVERPSKPHERKVNTDLKDKICKSDAWRDEFMLLLLDAYRRIGDKIEKPSDVERETEDYLTENDPVKRWLNRFYNTGLDATDKRHWLSANFAREKFKEDMGFEIAGTKLAQLLQLNGFEKKQASHDFKTEEWSDYHKAYRPVVRKAGNYWLGIERKRSDEMPDDDGCDLVEEA